MIAPAARPERVFDIVAFDVDGTLINGPNGYTVWEVLNRRFTGVPEVNRERYALYKAGKLSYAEWVELDVTGWRQADARREQIATALHGDPEQATDLQYVRVHTGFCREITVTEDDVERLGG